MEALMGENDISRRKPDDNHARLLRAAADLVRGKRLPPDGCMSDGAFDRLFESHKREGLAVRDACDALRERAEKAERERDDLRVDAEVLSDRYAEVRALADAYIDIVNRTARALGIPEVDEDGATPSLHDVPERVGRLVASDAEFRKWVGTGRDGCPPYSSDVAWQLQRLDESFKALHDGAEVVRRERNKLLGDIEMLGYMLGMGPDDDTSPEAVLRFAERLNRGEEPTDDDATQDPPGWWGGERCRRVT